MRACSCMLGCVHIPKVTDNPNQIEKICDSLRMRLQNYSRCIYKVQHTTESLNIADRNTQHQTAPNNQPQLKSNIINGFLFVPVNESNIDED